MGLFSYTFKASRCKAQLQMVVGRKRLQKNKKEIANKATRKAVAELLAADKLENAAIKVESVLQEEALLKAFELVELYAELLAVRMPLIDKEKTCPEDMREAVASLVFAAPTLSDLPELLVIRKELAAKYTKEWVQETTPMYLNPDMREWLTVRTPDPAVKFERMQAIAEEYKIEWDAEAARVKLLAGRPAAPSQAPVSAPSRPQPVQQQVQQLVQLGAVQAPAAPQQQVVYVQQPPPEVLMAQPVQLTYAPPQGTMAVHAVPPPAGFQYVQSVPPPASDGVIGDSVACDGNEEVAMVGAGGSLPTPVLQQQGASLPARNDEKQAKEAAAEERVGTTPTLDDVLKANGELPTHPSISPPAEENPATLASTAAEPPADELDELEARFAALKRG